VEGRRAALQYRSKLEEVSAFRERARDLLADKDGEIARLLASVRELQEDTASGSKGERNILLKATMMRQLHKKDELLKHCAAQEALLNRELEQTQAQKARSTINVEYLHNIMVKFLEQEVRASHAVLPSHLVHYRHLNHNFVFRSRNDLVCDERQHDNQCDLQI
jgi:hypothetical protein